MDEQIAAVGLLLGLVVLLMQAVWLIRMYQGAGAAIRQAETAERLAKSLASIDARLAGIEQRVASAAERRS